MGKKKPKKLGFGEKLEYQSQIEELKQRNGYLLRVHKLLSREIRFLKRTLSIIRGWRKIRTHVIKPSNKDEVASEAVAVVLFSDVHMEETVTIDTVDGLNEYNMSISKKRQAKFWIILVKLIGIFQKDIPIKTLILWLGGDFISGHIHDELKETTEVAPIDAVWAAQNEIASGIKYVLANTELNLIIPCAAGNHGRTTEKVHFATENGHSLEYYMYKNLQKEFGNEKRVTFIISGSYLTYIEVFGYTLRFHHGHAVKYQGGIGGIFIPMFKAISQWDKARRADYSFCGHFHQMKDGANFVSNGSVIGYNPFAIRIKADYERPKQAFILIDRDRGKTVVTPIVLDEKGGPDAEA